MRFSQKSSLWVIVPQQACSYKRPHGVLNLIRTIPVVSGVWLIHITNSVNGKSRCGFSVVTAQTRFKIFLPSSLPAWLLDCIAKVDHYILKWSNPTLCRCACKDKSLWKLNFSAHLKRITTCDSADCLYHSHSVFSVQCSYWDVPVVLTSTNTYKGHFHCKGKRIQD